MFLVKYGRDRNLGLKVINRLWVLTTCSPLSGQMTFKDWTESRGLQFMDQEDLKEHLKAAGEKDPQGQRQAGFGITSDGEVRLIFQEVSYADYLDRVVEVSRLLKLGIGKDPFVTSEGRHPVLTDGTTGFKIDQCGSVVSLVFPKNPERKVLRLILDPITLTSQGELATPLQTVLDRINEHEDIFADPFAERDLGKRSVQIAKQIMPGLRKKVRAIQRGAKKEAA